MDKMSIPYERFVHCPDHKLLYNFNKYVCKISYNNNKMNSDKCSCF